MRVGPDKDLWNISMGLLLILFCFHMLASGAGEAHPQRIISLMPSVTEEIYLLNAEDKLVANTTYCIRPEEAKKKEKIGTIIGTNLERIVQLEPDIVLASSLTHPKTKEKLKNLGIEVITFPQPKNFTELSRQFMELAKLVDEEKEGEEIVGAAKSKVASVKQNVKGLRKPKVFMQIGANPLFAANKDSFINDFIELAGGINIARDARTGLYSREEVLKRNPDVIIITTMGIVGGREKKIWQKYTTVNAVRNNRIHIVDSHRFCSPTPVTFVEALEEMVRILHPEIY
jgi:iron complex transport system substrate-binding protein